MNHRDETVIRSFLWSVVLIFLLLQPIAIHAQQHGITLSLKGVPLEQLIKQTESQSDYRFVYESHSVDVNQSINVEAKNASIQTVLNQALKGTNLSWRIQGNKILLVRESSADTTEDTAVVGRVSDAAGEPIIGGGIQLKGTGKGTVTDMEGRFILTGAKPGDALVFSCIGYTSKEIIWGGQPLQVILDEDNNVLDELVVIGYGTARKKDLTGSVVQVRPDDLQSENPQTVQDILRGTAGLNVGYSSTAKGGGSVSIRGQRSVYTSGGHNDPLIILDGMMFYGETSEINPDDIQQIDILKDASSAAIFGAKAANGVILITTKKGKAGKPVINFSANVGVATVYDFWHPWDNQDDYLKHYQDWMESYTAGYNAETGQWEYYQKGAVAATPGYYSNPTHLPAGVSIDQWRSYSTNDEGESDLSIWARRLGFKPDSNALANLLAGKLTNWEDISFRKAFTQDYSASVSGASDRASYYLSFGYLNNQGVRAYDDYQTYRVNLKVSTKITKWLEMGANVNFQERTDGEIGWSSLQFDNCLFADYLDENGKYVQYPLDGNYAKRGYNYDFERQYLELERGYTTLNTIFNTTVRLPLGITYQFNISPRFQFYYNRYFMSAALPGSNPSDRGVDRSHARRFDWSLNQTLAWDRFFGAHHVMLTLGQEAEDRRYWSDTINARDILPTDALGFHNTQNATREESSFSTNDTHESADALFARAFYSYDDRYMITATLRRDGYSAFGYSNPYAVFPSVGVAWTFTNEKFWKWSDFMDYGKIRFSYGKNGNRSLDNPYVAMSNLYSGAGKTFGYIQENGTMQEVRYLMVQRLANPGLQWEKTTASNLGLDFSFFRGRVSGSIEGYLMQTHDMIMNKKIPSITGFDSITTNLGQVDNDGFEFTLNTVNLRRENFCWETQFTLSYNRNRIRHLYGEYEDVLDESGKVVGQKEMDDTTNGWFIDQPIDVIWDYEVTGIWQKDEWEEAAKYGQVPGDPKVANNYTQDDVQKADGSVEHVYNNKDKVFMGASTAPWRWSMRNEFTLFRDFTLAVNMYSKLGGKRTTTNYLNDDDSGGNMTNGLVTRRQKTYWTIDNPTTWEGRIDALGPTGVKRPVALCSTSFIRLNSISLAYSLPSALINKWSINKAKVFASVSNPLMIGFDKHWVYGDVEANGLSIRTYQMGVNISF